MRKQEKEHYIYIMRKQEKEHYLRIHLFFTNFLPSRFEIVYTFLYKSSKI